MNELILHEKDGLIFAEGPHWLLSVLYGQERVEPHPFLEEWGMVLLEPDELEEREAA
jgi:hypothetical protein